ncbi:MAG: N-acetylmuramoyl-L-alanine amidase [Anaerolineae bacterium]|nr:N-acetylmuramoyl-L-alanine amidase [Anaerolineae bacterium]
MSRPISRRRLLTLILTSLAAAGGAIIAWLTHRPAPIVVVIEPTQIPPTPTTIPSPTPQTLVIVPRDQWGARPPDHGAINEFGVTNDPTNPAWYVYPDNLADVYSTVAIHHSAILLSTNETMRDVQDLHMDTNHWADVGYHYCIDKNGIVYEGRNIHARGSSVAGYNTGTIGVCVMGNFEIDFPLEIQLTKLQQVVNWLTTTYTLTHLATHHEFNPESVCPGKNMLAYIDPLAQKAGLERGIGGYVKPI